MIAPRGPLSVLWVVVITASTPARLAEPGRTIGIEPILSLHTQIVYLRDVPAGKSIGYGGTYRTKGRARIATLPVVVVGISVPAGIMAFMDSGTGVVNSPVPLQVPSMGFRLAICIGGGGPPTPMLSTVLV